MSIQNEIQIINSTEQIVTSLEQKYADVPLILLELKKLKQSLEDFSKYLQKLNELKPNFSIDEINEYFAAINLHLDILKVELKDQDYKKLNHKIRILKTLAKFHPGKNSFIKFIIQWVMELFYFI